MQSGRYRLRQRIGRGGYAEVFDALACGEEGFERRVALKRLLQCEDKSARGRFLDEARIAGQLHHSGIVAVLDYGLLEGVPFQVLEFVDGLDLGALGERARERAGGVPVEVALHLCREVALALRYAHGARGAEGAPLGIVHRDVSPGNVLVSWEGEVKLADFGIAVARGRLEQTRDGAARGKLAFMPPEQALGAEVDARADVFALGCVLHWLLVGRSPTEGREGFEALLAGEDPALERSLEGPLRALLADATRAQRERRLASAELFAERAGELLRERGASEGRAELRSLLAKLREAPSPSKARGRLDALLEVDLVLDTSAPAEASANGTEPLRCFEAVSASKGREEPLPAAPPRRVRWPLGLAGAAALAALFALRGRGERGEGSLARAALAPAVRAPTQPSPAPPALPPAPAPPSPEVTQPPPSAERVSAPLERRERRASAPTAPAPAAPAPAPTPAASPPAAREDGWLRVSFRDFDDAAARAETWVDGRVLGHGPMRRALPAGAHRVRVVSASGAVLYEGELSLSGSDSPSRPRTLGPF